jgi:hypothetical protein
MIDTFDSGFDEDVAMDALSHSLGRDAAKREYERELKGHPQNLALEKWGPMIEEMIMRDMARMEQEQKPDARVVQLARPREGGGNE